MAIRYLLDTNILIQYVRDNQLAEWIENTYGLAALGDRPLTSIVNEGEIRSLALQFGWGSAKKRTLSNLLSDIIIVPLDRPEIVEAYAQIDFYSERNGRPMGKNDIWIAATALVTQATLLTTDKDFDHLYPVFLQRDWINPVTV